MIENRRFLTVCEEGKNTYRQKPESVGVFLTVNENLLIRLRRF